MKLLPSLQTIKTEGAKTFLRFPMALLVGFTITILGILLIEMPSLITYDTQEYFTQTILSLIFSFPLFASLALIAERKKFSTSKFLLANLAVLALTIIYYTFILPNPAYATENGWPDSVFKMIIVLNLCSILFATFAPFIYKKENLGFWQYNKHIVIGLFITFVYSLVLFLGISLILGTIDTLFEIQIDSETYAEFFVVIAGIFSPILFFSNIPHNLDALNQEKSLPKITKNFAQYVLTPLISVYTIILYFYGGKILITQVWPNGLVSLMVIGYAIVGIINLIILHPYSDLSENKWINVFRKLFYISLIPLVWLLFAAVGIRINQYGITENRYYALLLGVWLTATAIYALLVKEKNLKLIPISVSIILVLSLFGPWSAFSVATHSQTNRFNQILDKYNLVEEGKLVASIDTKTLEKEDVNELGAIISYFSGNHNFSTISPLVQDALPENFTTIRRWGQESAIYEAFNIPAYDRNSTIYKYNYNIYRNNTNATIDIQGFSNLTFMDAYYGNDASKISINNVAYLVSFNGLTIDLKNGNKTFLSLNLEEKLRELVESGEISNDYESKTLELTKDNISIEFENENVKGKLYINDMIFDLTPDKEKIESFSGTMLTNLK